MFRRFGGEVLSQRWERTQRIAGDAADGHFVPIGPLTPGPPFTGVTPWVRQKISGAKNLSGGQRFLLGHRALGLQNLELLRFQNCAWLYRANAPGANPGGRPKGLPYPITEEFFGTVGAAISRPKAFPLQGGRWLAEGQTDEGALLKGGS